MPNCFLVLRLDLPSSLQPPAFSPQPQPLVAAAPAPEPLTLSWTLLGAHLQHRAGNAVPLAEEEVLLSFLGQEGRHKALCADTRCLVHLRGSWAGAYGSAAAIPLCQETNFETLCQGGRPYLPSSLIVTDWLTGQTFLSTY